MTFLAYLKDRLMMILACLAGMAVVSGYLLVCGLTALQCSLLLAAVSICLLAALGINWYQRKTYFDHLFETLDHLEKPYLLAELMPAPWRLEDRLYRELLSRSSRSVINTVHHLETEHTEYKEFIEGWIHETKVPLTSICLICGNHRTEETRRILEEAEQLNLVVEKALYFARSDSVYKDYLIRKLPLRDTVLEAVYRYQAYFRRNRMKIDLLIDGKTTVYSDGKWLEFMLGQVFVNAVNYRNGSSGTLRIYCPPAKSGVCLAVEDHGIGIPEKELGRIFDKGFTGSNGRKKADGQADGSTGLGLYLCRKLCRKLSICIDAESVRGEYTRILFYFPDGGSLFARSQSGSYLSEL